MLEKKTVIERIEIMAGGSIQVRFAKLIVEGEKVISHQWHRCAFDPGTDVDAVLAAVNNHLEQMGEARCEETTTPLSTITPQILRETVSRIHTPELIQKYKDERARQEAAMRPPPQAPI